MILLIDNYDSFTYNLYQLMGAINPDIRVCKNNELTSAEIEALCPSHIVISPGPGKPRDAGVCEEVIERMAGKVPALGVCLGHQAICEKFGAEVSYAARLMHGKTSDIRLDGNCALFQGLPPVIKAARYHSLAAKRRTIPANLLITAEDEEGEVMGVAHRDYDVYGVQFHPESILTPLGPRILENFLKVSRSGGAR
jgi:anthranilate synthase component 2